MRRTVYELGMGGGVNAADRGGAEVGDEQAAHHHPKGDADHGRASEAEWVVVAGACRRRLVGSDL